MMNHRRRLPVQIAHAPLDHRPAPAPTPTRRDADAAEQLQREVDLKLVRAIQDGDETALEQMYQRYSALVHAVCLRVLGQTADAEETTLEVFWELWDKPYRYDAARGSVVSYLMVLARSRAIDRRRSRKQGAALRLDEDDDQSARPRPPAIPAATPEPIEDAGLKEQRYHVVKGLDLLTASQREAVVLSFFDGLSHQQIAAQLGEPLGTIKTRIRQGILRLRDGLSHVESASPPR